MKPLSKTILIVYLVILLWLVLFKFSFDIGSVIFEHQSRSLSLIPFGDVSQANLKEIIYNFIVFIPFGLLLSVNFKRVHLWVKLALIFSFSVVAEIVQFVLAIGTTDITDVITNTLGGLLGLGLYEVFVKHFDNEKWDRFILIVSIVLLTIVIFLRLFVLRVRY